MGQHGKQRPSSGLAALTHLPKKGEGCASRIKPSPQGGRCRTKRGGRGVLRRALLPRMGQHGKQRPSSGLAALTHLPPRGKVALRGLSLPLRGKVPNEERRKRGYCAGRYFPEWDNTESNAPHPASLRSPTFPKRGKAALRGLSLPLRGEGAERREAEEGYCASRIFLERKDAG